MFIYVATFLPTSIRRLQYWGSEAERSTWATKQKQKQSQPTHCEWKLPKLYHNHFPDLHSIWQKIPFQFQAHTCTTRYSSKTCKAFHFTSHRLELFFFHKMLTARHIPQLWVLPDHSDWAKLARLVLFFHISVYFFTFLVIKSACIKEELHKHPKADYNETKNFDLSSPIEWNQIDFYICQNKSNI